MFIEKGFLKQVIGREAKLSQKFLKFEILLITLEVKFYFNY